MLLAASVSLAVGWRLQAAQPSRPGLPHARLALRLRGSGAADSAQRRLFMAVQLSDVDGVEAALSEGADVHARDPMGAMALHMASTRGSTEVVQALLHHGAAVEGRLPSGPTALHLAAEAGHDEAVSELLEAGADVNAPAEFVGVGGQITGCSWTPLFFAAAHGHLEVVRCLLLHGARVLLKDEAGMSALDVAERWRQRPHDLARNASAQTCPPEDESRARLVQLLQQFSGTKARSVQEQEGLSMFRSDAPIPSQEDDDNTLAPEGEGATAAGEWESQLGEDGRPRSPPAGFDDREADYGEEAEEADSQELVSVNAAPGKEGSEGGILPRMPTDKQGMESFLHVLQAELGIENGTIRGQRDGTAADACVTGKDDGAREQAERGSRLSADQGDAEIQGVLTDLLSPSTALVKHATQCGPSRVEIRSLENEIIVVQVSERGWEVVSRSNTQQLVGACYETITALMMRVSKGYMAAFSSEIARCLTEQRT